jgi:hypothetical protein
MSDASVAENQTEKGNQVLFWGCFIALITTSFAFFTRMYLCDVRFGADFGIGKVTIGELKGAGVWPFAISIILFSLIIDRIGYRVAMPWRLLRPKVTAFCIGAASYWDSETEPSKRSSTQLSPRCSVKRKPNG